MHYALTLKLPEFPSNSLRSSCSAAACDLCKVHSQSVSQSATHPGQSASQLVTQSFSESITQSVTVLATDSQHSHSSSINFTPPHRHQYAALHEHVKVYKMRQYLPIFAVNSLNFRSSTDFCSLAPAIAAGCAHTDALLLLSSRLMNTVFIFLVYFSRLKNNRAQAPPR